MASHRILDTVLILSDNEVHARRDKQSLKSLNPASIQLFIEGAEALDFLADHPVDMVLCDTRLADMDGVRFLKLLRQNMNLKKVPVVMVSMENRKNKVLDAISAGCTGYVLRPYSVKTFENHLKLALNVEKLHEIEELQLAEARNMVASGDFDEAIETYEEILSVQDEAQKYYDMGCNYLLRQRYGKAIISFKKAVKVNNLFAEAFKGLADAFKGKGDIESYTLNLKRAAEVYAQFDRMEETKALFIEILKYESSAANPFNTLGVRLRKEGDYIGAIHAYEQAIKLTPQDHHVHYNMAKAYYFMGDTPKALTSTVRCLECNGGFPEARRLYAKLSGKEWQGGLGGECPAQGEGGGPSMVDSS